jgi:hypothetical protein
MGWAPPAVVVVGEMPLGRSPPEGGEARGRGEVNGTGRETRVVVVVVGICGGGERARASWGKHSGNSRRSSTEYAVAFFLG